MLPESGISKFNIFLIVVKNVTAPKHLGHIFITLFLLGSNKIWKVLRTLGTIPSFTLPRETNARKMLR